MTSQLPFEVPTTPVGSASWRFEDLSPRRARGDRLVFRPPRALLLIGAALVLAILGFLAIEHLVWKPLWNSGDRPPMPLDGLFKPLNFVFDTAGTVVQLIVLLGGVGVMLCWFVAGRVVFDRRRRMAFRKGGKADRIWAGGIPFRVIAAVQACPGQPAKTRPSGRRKTSDESDDRVFEMNLVLSTPAGERVNVTTGRKRGSLCADAQRLAEFLRVPLLDHATS